MDNVSLKSKQEALNIYLTMYLEGLYEEGNKYAMISSKNIQRELDKIDIKKEIMKNSEIKKWIKSNVKKDGKYFNLFIKYLKLDSNDIKNLEIQ